LAADQKQYIPQQAFHDQVEMVMAKSVPNVVAGIDFGEAKPNDFYW